ncbi:MAG: M61 family metallopeptidase [Crocinitomicaceae bacterium]
MLKKAILLILVSFLNFIQAQTVSYKLSMPKPQNHYFNVEMHLEGVKGKETEIKMPVWAPGSYLVREFSKNLNLVKAFDEKGNPLKIEKNAKNKWIISNSKAKNIIVKYEVYAFELSVRTSFLDLSHGFVSGSGIFMYTEKTKNQKGKLTIIPYKGFKTISTALPKIDKHVFEFNNYDHLVDCPIEIGNQKIFEFDAAGVKHTVAMYGEGNYDIDKLKIDMKKIIESTSAVVGVNPNKNYTFIIHNVVDGQGGLEHMNSTTLSVNRWTYEGNNYINFLSLVAHEYFHLWNVKRIRPIELGPFNYDEENYTTLLWVMEGFTSYYDELLLYRADFISAEQYINKLSSALNYVEGTVGTRVQPVAHASFDAWIKGYRPNENSSNTTMTYYTRGAILAAYLDALIINKSKGQQSLDNFLQALYTDFYINKNRGFSEEEFKKALEGFIGDEVDSFFSKYIHGTEVPNYSTIFANVGLDVTYIGSPSPSLGASFYTKDGKTIIRRIRANSSAENSGLSVNDEIVGCNGYRVDRNSFVDMVSRANVGDQLNVLISREEQLFEIIVTIESYERPKYQLKLKDDSKTEIKQQKWLEKK